MLLPIAFGVTAIVCINVSFKKFNPHKSLWVICAITAALTAGWSLFPLFDQAPSAGSVMTFMIALTLAACITEAVTVDEQES